MKIFSITEIVQATNNILNSEKNYEQNHNDMISDPEPLKLTKEVSTTSNDIKNNNLKNNSIPKKTEEIIKVAETQLFQKKKIIKKEKNNFNDFADDLYFSLKKKVKKNTLKVLIDQQNEIENLKNKIDSFKIEIKNLNKNSNGLKEELTQFSINNKSLIKKNNDIEDKLNVTIKTNENLKNDKENISIKFENVLEKQISLEKENEKFKKDLDEKIHKNRSYEINNNELKNTISRYIINTKKLQNENNQLKKDQLSNIISAQEIKDLKENVNF